MRGLAILIVITGSLFGQRILYNQDLDTKGKATDTAAKKLTSSTATTNELQNLAVLEKAQIDRIMADSVITMRRNIQGLNAWSDVPTLIKGIQDGIKDVTFPVDETPEQQQADVDAQTAALKQQLAKLKAASKQNPPSLTPVINLLGDVKDLTDFVGSNGKIKEVKAASAATQKIVDGLKEINTLIGTVANIWSTAKAVSVDPGSLAPSKEETELAVLAVEVQWLKEITALRMRQQIDNLEVQSTLKQLQIDMDRVKPAPEAQIRDDLNRIVSQLAPPQYASLRSQLLDRIEILHLVGSAAAQNTIAADVEGVRESLAWRRYQIKVAAVYNGSYETAIQAASSRLAAYYAAGLKPTQIAQLIHDLMATVTLPKIAF